MRKSIFRLFSLATLALSPSVFAAATDQSAVSFGNRVSVATLVNALQSNGYQALVSKPPQLPETVLGVISTGSGGAKVNILVVKCPNAKDDEVCALSFFASYNDEKNIMNDTMAMSMNAKASMSKVTMTRRPDGKLLFNILYSYPCKDFDDTKFVNTVLQSFGADITLVLSVYNGAGTNNLAAAPVGAKP